MASYELHILNSYHELKKIGLRVKRNLPWITEILPNKDGIYDLDDKGNTIGKPSSYKSHKLEVLANKIDYMIYKGRAHDVEPMLRSIIKGKIKCWGWEGNRKKRREKTLSFEPYKHLNSEVYHIDGDWFCYGHFRHAKEGYILTEREIQRIKEYFKL